ncbi:glycoside hydrolase superfamily [Crepidotus variabilis]|uniref:glucan 1,3-beta-glucosidase n=1 Tax=Crepidotus variabilis TaxID=179855 RepID=A0A9P6EEF8_9AGAR|nr:glycoside hydrolase superfamily [Crepidotus variabilis]
MSTYAPVSNSEHELARASPSVMADSDPWDSQLQSNQNLQGHSTPLVNTKERALSDRYGPSTTAQQRKRKRLIWIAVIAVAIVAIGVGVGLGVGLTRKSSSGGGSGGSTGSSGGGSSGSSGGGGSGTSGKSGSIITEEDGTKFTYKNDFGGEWAQDPKQPFAAGGKAQSWSPRVGSEDWTWGQDIVRGVNLGGWLVTEPFIVPALYEEYVGKSNINVLDEWTLSQAMGSDLATKMENHYKTFVTEQDFADIAAAGLNWVRIPIGFWAIETINDEPFLTGTSWKYFLKAIQWARKYGIRIYLDLHALPGSQNGWNHSGKSGSINFMYGTMGIANAQRTLSYLRTIVEFVSQPQYKDVVPMVGLVNEILWGTIQKEAVQSFYYAAYETIRKSTGTGQGPYIAIHEGFQGPAIWEGFLAGADRVVLDQHPVSSLLSSSCHLSNPAFTDPSVTSNWAVATNQSSKAFGVTIGGEFSAAINNCGKWLNGIGDSPATCDVWEDWANYSADTVSGLKEVALASMDALQNFFYWTWKIGNSTVLNTSTSPMWNYKLGLQQGWIPKDPREAIGYCGKVLPSTQSFDGIYPSTATGGAGAGTLDAAKSSANPFPPATVLPSFSGTQVALMPTYTPTGSLKTLPVPTFTAAPKVSVGTGWTNQQDNDPAYVPVSGCQYPNAWDAESVPLPATTCA